MTKKQVKYLQEDEAAHHLHTKVFERWPQDDDELHLFMQVVWGITFPRTKVCDDHVAPFTAFADAYFGRNAISVWEASRGFGGKTQMLALLCLTEALTMKCGVTILGGSGAQSLMVKHATNMAWDWPNAPKDILAKNTQFDTVLSTGGWIRSLTASPTSVRGPHPLRLRLDEVDEMEMKILEAAQGQPMRMPQHPEYKTQTVMSSTHQYPKGTFTEILKRAETNGWAIQKWCFLENSNPIDGWLSSTEIERKKTEISTKMWETEYELQEPSFEGRAIDTEAVEKAFNILYGGEFTGEDMKIGVFGTPDDKINRHSAFVTGVDWAKEKHFVVCATFNTEKTPWKCVQWQRFHHMPWPDLVLRVEQQWRKWGGKLIHDSAGVGDVVDDYIDVTPAERRARIIIPEVLVGRRRSDVFTDYIAGIESGGIVYPRIEVAYNDHKYVTNADLFQTGGHPPDSFIAGALAWSTRPAKKQTYENIVPISIEKVSSWMA